MTFRILLLVSIVFSSTTSLSQSRDGLNRTIESLLTEQKLSGAVWATVSPTGDIVTDAAGYKNAATKTKLSASDKVQVGSVSKTILAAGFLRMATVGFINLDSPVKNYLPELPIDNSWEETSPVTIRHLLDHTSGLTDARLWHVFSTTATPDTALESVYIDNPGVLRIQAKPGTIYSYSNLGYTILGMVIEKITQTRYETFLDENLLKPLGMLHSTFTFVTQDGDHADIQLAAGHFDDGQPVFAMPMYLRPAGQFTTTAKDMGIFLRFMMSDGVVNGASFIASEYLESVGKQQLTDAYKNGLPYGDALGGYSRDRYGVVGIAKNGNILGFSSMIYMLPDHKKAFFIAHNMDSETANYDVFNEALVRYLDVPSNKFIRTNKTTEHELQRWSGYYIPVFTKVQPFGLIDHLFSHAKVMVTNNGALFEPMQGKKKELLYQGNFLFSMDDRTDNSHAFYEDESGRMLITDGYRTIRKVHGLKIIGIAASLSFGLLAIVFVFVSGIVKLLRSGADFVHEPIFWIFLSILIVVISIAFIANQRFMRMGDETIGNLMLAVGTLLMPLFSTVSLFLAIISRKRFFRNFSFWAIVLVMQFCGLLMVNGLIPVMMWR